MIEKNEEKIENLTKKNVKLSEKVLKLTAGLKLVKEQFKEA